MAKESVKVDNGLEEIELASRDKMDKKKEKNKDKKTKENKKQKSNSEKKGFFRKVIDELKLVTWPTKKNVTKYSIAAVIMVVLLAAFFVGISALFDLIYALVQGWIG